ncbi:alpha/beta fold hydrolase, partial [Streptomyces alkaliterrae]
MPYTPTTASPTAALPTARREHPRPVARPHATPPAARPRTEEREHHFDGFRYISRRVTGAPTTKPPLLVLGGSSQDRHSWARHEPHLLHHGDVLTADLPGYGTADHLPARYGIDFLAATVRHLLDELDLPRVDLVGACFGGAIAVRVAQHYPQHLGRLLLVGMTDRVPDDYTACAHRWRRMMADGERHTVADELVTRFLAAPTDGTVRRQTAVARFLHRQFVGQNDDEVAKWSEHNLRLTSHEWFRPEPLPA